MTVRPLDSNELGWVRLELGILASSRTLAPLTDKEQVRFDVLAQRERELALAAAVASGTAAPGARRRARRG